MSINYLSLRLQSPFQAWGFNSQFDARNTGFWPTKSGLAGMICAALGYDRGSDSEKIFLSQFASVQMTAIQIPRLGKNPEYSHSIRHMHDFHTVQNTVKAGGGVKDTHLTHRYYLNDADFGVVLKGESRMISEIAGALKNPVWGVWLGRKNCIPSCPVFAGGPFETEEKAFQVLIGLKKLDNFDIQEQAESFEEGTDSLPDEALSFDIAKRIHIPRRVRYSLRKGSTNGKP
ncbi:MAG TPA: type I-E CRISPR-associated protein Cas5/CasD [Spirochaetia bacterium]|nr:type I-E CRISPR-associated protein Cas5/CasD [Spirochaetia bacterium]